jgi:transcriptional regulator with XRE-family HTH domain
MDQVKIGKFIAQCRKRVNLTQMQLAEKLGITDRAVSKWENGKSLPDSSVMLELCDILGITVNDLLSGEVIAMDNYEKEMEKKLLEMMQQKEKHDKWLLTLEVVVGVMCIAIMLALILIAALVNMEEWLRLLLIVVGMLPLVICCPFLLRIEQVAGYYECKNCHHRYMPAFKAINLAPHIGRSRQLRCPECGKKAWHKKVLTKE